MTAPNTNQPGSLKPQPKVAAGGLAGALTIFLVWVLGVAGVEMPTEVAAAVGALITAGVAWLTPNR